MPTFRPVSLLLDLWTRPRVFVVALVAGTLAAVAQPSSTTADSLPGASKGFEADVELETMLIKAKRSDAGRKGALEGQVVDLRAKRSAPTGLKEALQSAPGIHLRQNGGAGSDFNLNLNGLQGKAVRVFVDGVPLDARSADLALTNLSVEDIERIEVYKGVLPTELGADALGGGINLITRRIPGDAAEGSYQIGSFGEHRVQGRVNKQLGEKAFTRVDAGWARADNDYEMDILATDPVTRRQVLQRVRRFHDGYTMLNADARTGLADPTRLGNLEAGVRWNSLEKEYQHGASAAVPYGRVEGSVTELAPRIDWSRSWLDGRLESGVRSEYIWNRSTLTDTSHLQYYWNGTADTTTRAGGEINTDNMSRAHLDTRTIATRSRLRYEFDTTRALVFNYVWLGLERQGADPYGEKLLGTNIDPLTIPTNYHRHYLALGFEGKPAGSNWSYEVIAKAYTYSLRGPTNEFGYWENSFTHEQGQYGGGAAAVKWKPWQAWTLRLAYERAIRFPDQDELLGDGFFTLPNYTLKPEHSHNANLGAGWTNGTVGTGRIAAEANFFARLQSDIIVQRNIGLVFSSYQNDAQARSTGLEIGGLWQPWIGAKTEGNATYQSLRKQSAKDISEEYLIGSRLANIPYFFANLGFTQQFKSVARGGDELELSWSARYVHEFLLYPIPPENEPMFFWQRPDVNTEYLIPSQFLQNLGLTYHLPGRRLSLGVEARNILDEPAYDNFRVPRPGRSYHAKLTARY